MTLPPDDEPPPSGRIPRWTSENRPLIDRSKPATTPVASETEVETLFYDRTRSSTTLASSVSFTTDASIKSQDMSFLVVIR
jgi:hypothetical protein